MDLVRPPGAMLVLYNFRREVPCGSAEIVSEENICNVR